MKYLIIDDDLVFRERLQKALCRSGFEAQAAANAKAALEFIAQAIESQQPFQRVICDLKMPGMSGLDLIEKILDLDHNLEILILTGYGSIATTQSAIKKGAISYLTKPSSLDRILAAFDEDRQQAIESVPTPSLYQVEWEHIQRILSDCQGNITNAAKKLGINRRSLQRRLAKAPKLS